MFVLIWFGLAALAFDTCAQSRPQLSLQIVAGTARLSLAGELSSPLTVQYATNLPAGGGWQLLSNFTLLASPTLILDPVATNLHRFYQAVIAVPTNTAWLPAGTFLMGSPTNEVQRFTNEFLHPVTLTRGLYARKYLVTQGDYLSLMNTNPSFYVPSNGFSQDLTRPVEQVSWFDATNYCARLTQQEQTAGRILTNWAYRLPTEAEWEYACRAGTTNPFCLGNDLRSGMANFFGEYEYVGGTGTVFNQNGVVLERTSAVGSYSANAWGLYDMVGNVWEWCQDWYGNYPTNSVTNPQGPGSGSVRVFRGGSLDEQGKDCRSARRFPYDPAFGANTVGFRVVLSAAP